MKFIKTILSILFFTISILCYSQVTKFKTTSFSSKIRNENTNKWTDWTELTESEILISIDLTNKRIKIFSEEEQIFDIIKYNGKNIDSDNDEAYSFKCVDKNGLKCNVVFAILNSLNGQNQLIVTYYDVKLLYNIYLLD